MTIDINDLAFERQVTAFIKKETAFGVLADFASSDAIMVNALPRANQALSFSDSRAKRNTRSLPRRFRDNTPAGQVSLSAYVTPSGAAGTPPAEAAIWEGFFGQETITPASKVEYTPTISLPSLSMAFKAGHTTTFVTGWVVGTLGLEIGSKDGFELSGEGSCKKVAVAGTGTTVAGSTTTVIKLDAGEAKLFEAGARVEVGDDDNTGAGYTIESTDTAADTITITPAMAGAPDAGETVQGFLPTATYSGEALANNLAVVTLDGANLVIESGRLNLEQEIKMRDDLVTNEDYPAYFVPGQRRASGELTAVFLRPYAKFFTQARSQEQMAFSLVLDDGAGKKLTLAMPQAECSTPEIAGDMDLTAAFSLTGLASSGEDEISATFE